MKKFKASYLWIALLIVFFISNSACAASHTPSDNHKPADQRTISEQLKMFRLTLTDATVSSVNVGADVKSAVIKCIGEDVLFNLSYHNGITQETGDLITAGTDKRIIRTFAGEAFTILQNTEFNYIFARIQDSTGSVTCYVYPGGGLSQ